MNTHKASIAVATLFALSLFCQGCNDAEPKARQEPPGSTEEVEGSQALSFAPRNLDLTEAMCPMFRRTEPRMADVFEGISKYALRTFHHPFCDPERVLPIDVPMAMSFLGQIRFPSFEVRERLLSFVERNQRGIVPLMVFVQAPEEPLYREQVLLRLVYSRYVQGDVPAEAGACGNGVFFNLTKLGVRTPFDGLFSDDPDDPNNPPPSPTSCLMTFGSYGPCCKCDAAWTAADGCNQSDNCLPGNCCHSSEDDLISRVCHWSKDWYQDRLWRAPISIMLSNDSHYSRGPIGPFGH